MIEEYLIPLLSCLYCLALGFVLGWFWKKDQIRKEKLARMEDFYAGMKEFK